MDLLELIKSRPILGDGAMGSLLQEGGFRSGDCPEAWNLERPEVILGIHKAYRDAGCDYVETNTFGASTIKLARYGLDSKIDDIVAAGVDLARRAVGDTCLIAASVGPTGGLLEPYGDYSRDQLAEAFGRATEAMERAGVDFYLIETMSDLNEAALAIAAAKAVSKKPVAATMAFTKGAKGYRTMMGTSPEDAGTGLVEAGADLVGTNCCSGPEAAAEIIIEMAGSTPLAVIAQPNAGLPELKNGCAVYPETPEDMAAGAESLLACGARVIGGCCGTTPAHMASMGSVIKSH
ncbi:MAG: homocysteine S-methyltransferase family protein [Candidatus Eisenbacteria bacterium]